MTPAALRALADAADALARIARAASEDTTGDPTAILPLFDAARIAGTSPRIVREAIRAGALTAYGRQRDRGVRRGDLDAWIDTRRMRPIAGADDPDIDRRVRILERLTPARRGAR